MYPDSQRKELKIGTMVLKKQSVVNDGGPEPRELFYTAVSDKGKCHEKGMDNEMDRTIYMSNIVNDPFSPSPLLEKNSFIPQTIVLIFQSRHSLRITALTPRFCWNARTFSNLSKSLKCSLCSSAKISINLKFASEEVEKNTKVKFACLRKKFLITITFCHAIVTFVMQSSRTYFFD